MTEISDRTPAGGRSGPAVRKSLGSYHAGADQPVGTPDRVAMGMASFSDVGALRQVGTWLSHLKEPEPPKGFKERWRSCRSSSRCSTCRPSGSFRPRPAGGAGGEAVIWTRSRSSTAGPAMWAPWSPGASPSPGPLQEAPESRHLSPAEDRQEQAHHALAGSQGGAIDFREWQEAHPGERFPVVVALGADPATIPRRRDAGAGYPLRIRLRGSAAGQPHRGGKSH